MGKLNEYFAVGLMMILGAAQANAGVGSSGGGSAIVCRDGKHEIISAQLYDLYEAGIYYSYHFTPSNISPRDQILNVTKKLDFDQFSRPLVLQTVQEIIQRIEFLPVGVSIAMPGDMGTNNPVIKPQACEVEGIGFYTADGKLRISRSVYAAFSNTDKAAFILHEALYQIHRELGGRGGNVEDSQLARQMNAALFSDNASAALQSLSTEMDYAMWFAGAENTSVPGSIKSDFTIRLTASDPTIEFNLVVSCGLTPRYESSPDQTVTSKNGVASLQMTDSPCFSLEGALTVSSIVSTAPKVKAEIIYRGIPIYTEILESGRTGDLGGGSSYKASFYARLVHPEIAISDLP
jgi:hypothetical protein